MRPALAALLVVAACKAEAPAVEKLVATPERSPPAVEVATPAVEVATPPERQQVQPDAVVLPSNQGEAIVDDSRGHPIPSDPSRGTQAPPRRGVGSETSLHRPLLVRIQAAIRTLPPVLIVRTSVRGQGHIVDLSGRAKTHEDVAELMRALSAFVHTPQGPGRIVERKRGSPLARVELLNQPGDIREFTMSQFDQMAVDLQAAHLLRSGEVSFQITVRNVLATQ